MQKRAYGLYSVEFKEEAVRRILKGERVRALQRETAVPCRSLYAWLKAYGRDGVGGLRGPGHPGKGEGRSSADREAEDATRVAELERKIGQQALEIDFLQRAFKRVKGSRASNTGNGVTASTGRSAR